MIPGVTCNFTGADFGLDVNGLWHFQETNGKQNNYFESYNVPPGLLAGASSISSETKQQFGWHFGGGLELPVFSSVKLVGDMRYVFLNYNFKSFPGSNGVNSNFYVMSVSLLFGL